MAKYTAIFTTYGTQVLAKAIANNQPLRVTHFAIGDGNGKEVTVSASQERLVNEKHRAAISAVSLDPRNNKQVIFELTIPENVGGFYIREMGVFDANNKLVAYANCPESFKPTLASGSGKVQVMRMILLVASSNAVTLTVDDSVIFVTRGQLTPKTITVNSANGFDNTGHSHAIDKASTTKAGIVQLTSDTGLESENLGLTAKAGKVLAQGIAALRLALNNYIPLKSRSSSVTSNDENGVATPKAVKTAYDKAVSAEENNLYQKIYVGKNDLQLDLTDRQQIINLFGDKYRNNGLLSFAAHNNSNSNITGLPLTNKSPIVMTLYLMGGYSIFYCDYPLLNRRFYSNVNFNNKTLTFNWIEHITSAGDQLDIKGYKSFNSTLESKYRFVVRRNEEKYSPYMWFIDQSVDMSEAAARNKSIGELTFSVGAGDGVRKNIIKSYVLEDKNAFLEFGGWDAENRYKILYKGFTKTGNVTIGTGNDNGIDRLQVNGTISANTPPVNATDDKVVTVGWAKQAGQSYVKKVGDTMTGQLTVPKIHLTENNTGESLKLGDDAWLGDVNVKNAIGVKGQQNPEQGYIAYGSGKKRFGYDGNMFFADSPLATNYIGHGSYAQQYNVAAPFYVHQTLSAARDTYHPFVKGRVRAPGQYGAAFSLGYTTNQRQGGDGFGAGVIHLIEDNGAERGWFFNHDGSFTSPGDVVTGDGKRLTKAHQTNYAYVETNTPNWGGLKINRNGEHMLIESNNSGGFNFVRRNNNGTNFYVLRTQTKNGTLATLEDIVVITGVIHNGATIPLPAGFAENECKFLVSMRSDNPKSTGWDIDEGGSNLHYRYECKLEGRKVIARTWLGGHYNTGNRWIDGEANYIVIGVKGA